MCENDRYPRYWVDHALEWAGECWIDYQPVTKEFLARFFDADRYTTRTGKPAPENPALLDEADLRRFVDRRALARHVIDDPSVSREELARYSCDGRFIKFARGDDPAWRASKACAVIGDITHQLFRKEMADYLMEEFTGDYGVVRAICHAPLSFAEKRKMLEQLKGNDIGGGETLDCIRTIGIVEHEFLDLRSGDFLTLELYLKDSEEGDCVWDDTYQNMEGVRRGMQKMTAEFADHPGDAFFIVKKWSPKDEYDYWNPISCIMIGGEMTYFATDCHYGQDLHGYFAWPDYDGADIGIPIAFRPGDIVTYDCSPCFSRVPAVIVDDTGSLDCCSVGVLYPLDDDATVWEISNLKHGHHDILHSVISPLFTLERLKGLLPEKLRVLEEVSRFIRCESNNGRLLYERICERKRESDRHLTRDSISVILGELSHQ